MDQRGITTDPAVHDGGHRWMGILSSILNNIGDGLKLGPTFPLRHISGILGRKYHVTTIKRVGTVHLRPKSSDAATFVQVFRKKEYDLAGSHRNPQVMATYRRILDAGQTPIIIDAGANVGAASIWFARLFPMALVLAIEPDADNAVVCRLNTCRLPNVKVVEAAIGSEGGQVSLNNHSMQDAWLVQTTRDEHGEISIRTISDLVREIPNASKLFIVKIDIEGFESDLFATNTKWMDNVDVIMIEPHDRLYPGTSKNFQKEIASRSFEISISGENLVCVQLPTQSAPEESREPNNGDFGKVYP